MQKLQQMQKLQKLQKNDKNTYSNIHPTLASSDVPLRKWSSGPLRISGSDAEINFMLMLGLAHPQPHGKAFGSSRKATKKTKAEFSGFQW